MTTIGALFQSNNEAERALDSLQAAGLTPDVARVIVDAEALGTCLDETRFGSLNWKLIGVATVLGAFVFGFAGFMAGVDNLRMGLAVLQQSLVLVALFGLTGAIVGAFLGIFIGYSDCECDTRLYVHGIQRGGAVVVVKAEGPTVDSIYYLLSKNKGSYTKLCGQPSGGH
ncbi:MAG: hypothetical protein GY759_00070 [Chloroflexi bacterium]|nr:hypothetical protein [Chloroflexota bacterium]